MFKAEETSLTAKICFKVEMESPFLAQNSGDGWRR